MSPTEPAAGLRFKDLCLDAVDPDAAARFWGPVLGLRAEPRGRHVLLHDEVPEHSVWLNRVPEPQTVKQRVHLDVHAASVEEVLGHGARLLREHPRWTELRDPEGGELCAFVRPPEELERYRLYELVVDAADPDRIAGWWAELFGVAVQREEGDDFCWLSEVPGMPWEIVFGSVPEPKRVKNRIHWDLWGDPADAVAAGARLLREPDDEISWTVLADPEGNEFCAFPPDEEA